MTTATVNQPTWAKAISHPAKEFLPTQLPIISGTIPPGIRGSLYRNGPARLERGGVRMGHWFDGDGAILGVHLNSTGATATYRYVQTAGYQAESLAEQLIYNNYGMTAPGTFWQKPFKPVKNAANTSVLALPDKLLALWEGGKPHVLDLRTLETIGEDDLQGLTKGKSYSAHYKRDPGTGEIFNFGITPGINATLNLYKSNGTGKIVKQAAHKINGVPLVHDFVLAGQYLLFFISPVRLNLFPVLLGLKCFGEAMVWQPQKGTQIIVINRETLEIVSRIEAEAWFQWHFANGYVDGSGTVVVDIARYEDFQTNQFLAEVATGETQTVANSHLSRVQLNPETGKLISIEKILDCQCEFPTVPAADVGKASRYTYLSTMQPGTNIGRELLNAIARYDHRTNTLTTAEFGHNRYPSEPIYIPDAEDAWQGWVITVVYDGIKDTTEIWIYDAERLNSEPVCKLGLPSVIPHSFHGTWKPA
jgi:carotenoid cleavage dioxygenase-like enzyme